MNRAKQFLGSLTQSANLIEVGPSINPLAPKQDGWNTVVVDHASREELVCKYMAHADVDTSRIEDVDFVWRGGSITDVVPAEKHGTFDAFIASHVIEHTTDFILFLQAAETLIHENGVVILIIPDKRKCFDIYRHPSTTGDAIAAFEQKRSRHDLRTHFEYYMRSAHKEGLRGWNIDDARNVTLATSFEFAREPLEISAQDEYVDAHSWIFVPSSFDLMITELSAMEYLNLRTEEIAEARSTEFHVWLRKGRKVMPPIELQARRKH